MGILGGIEAGGTKFVCGFGTCPDDLTSGEFATETPDRTIARVAEFFRNQNVSSIGVGCFGPLDLRTGLITSTPKLSWRNFDIVNAIRNATSASVILDTDVNVAALGENRWGAAQDVETFLYLTIGTGIGGGAMVNGKLLHGQAHPEMGHVRIPHDFTLDPFTGNCPSHGDCLEGLASGVAMSARWGVQGIDLPPDHPGWKLEAHYLALGIVNYACTLSPQRIVIGGGVMRHEGLLSAIRDEVRELLNAYIATPEIVLPALGPRAGVLGAIALAGVV